MRRQIIAVEEGNSHGGHLAAELKASDMLEMLFRDTVRRKNAEDAKAML
jgi:hypothetical protein